jgi:hypothetical protein
MFNLKIKIMFKKRIGPDPHADGGQTGGASGCPDIWELEDGTFAIIGFRTDKTLKTKLPESASCGTDEEIIIIPRQTLLRAKKHIPNK